MKAASLGAVLGVSFGLQSPPFLSLPLSSPSSARCCPRLYFSASRLPGGSEMRYPAPCAAWHVSFMHAFIHSFIHTEDRVLFQIREHHGQHYLLSDAGPDMPFLCMLVSFFIFIFDCAGSLLWLVGFLSCGLQAPECSGSVAVVRGLSSPVACGILVPQPRIEPASPA